MASVVLRFVPLAAVTASCISFAQYKTINPRVQEVVAAVSEERIAGIMQKLEGFGTRNVSSTTTDPARGVGAARQWIFDQFSSYSPRLEVKFDKHRIKAGGRVPKDIELWKCDGRAAGQISNGSSDRRQRALRYDRVRTARGRARSRF
jgi:hypothetical protein